MNHDSASHLSMAPLTEQNYGSKQSNLLVLRTVLRGSAASDEPMMICPHPSERAWALWPLLVERLFLHACTNLQIR